MPGDEALERRLVAGAQSREQLGVGGGRVTALELGLRHGRSNLPAGHYAPVTTPPGL